MKLFIVCSGLGTTRRGYETFFASLFDVLKDEPGLDLTLFKGGGARSMTERPLWNLPRESWLAKKIGEWLSIGCPTLGRGYYVEQASFFISLIPRLVLGRPDVVYFSDYNLGHFIWRWRRLSGQRFKLLFRNGGAYPPPYPRFDHVQQITSVCFDAAIAAGERRESQTLLPSGFAIPKVRERRFTKRELRESLGLPPDRTVILTVSAVNKSQKRLDYLIEELAMLPHPRPFLAILGQRGHESTAVEGLASAMLGADHYFIRTVPQDVVEAYYQAADIFVLASLKEGFGRVMVEALAAGLPCVVHDCEIMRYVLGEHGYFGDFTSMGALSKCLTRIGDDLNKHSHDPERIEARHRFAYARFSWDALRSDYVELIHRCASDPSTHSADGFAGFKELSVQLPDGACMAGLFHSSGDDAPVCVCLHGLGVDLNVWQFVAKELAGRGLNVLCLDLRGHGHSDRGAWWRLNPNQMARDLMHVCDTLEVQPSYVLTQSFGAHVGLAWLRLFRAKLSVREHVLITPAITLGRSPIQQLPREILQTSRFLRRLGSIAGFIALRRRIRRDHTLYDCQPDMHVPRIAEEVSTISWLGYAGLILWLGINKFRYTNWSQHATQPSRVIIASKDGLWHNPEVENVCNKTLWQVHHVEMQHLSVATKAEYAQKVVSLLPWVPESGHATTRRSLAAAGQQRQVVNEHHQ